MVAVTWDDAKTIDGWGDDDDKLTPCHVVSVGFLVRKTKDYIVLAQDLAPDGLICGRGQIPRGMVKKIKVLKKKD